MRLRVVCWFFDGRPLQLTIYVVAILSCLSPNLLAQGLTEPVTVSCIGPEGGRVNSIVVDPSDSNTVYGVSDTGVFKSADGGTTWSYSGLMGSYVSTIAIASQSPTTVYAAAPGNIFKSLDAGSTWNQVPGTPPNLILDAIDPQGTLFGRIPLWDYSKAVTEEPPGSQPASDYRPHLGRWRSIQVTPTLCT